MSKKDLKRAWEQRVADNFAQIDTRMPEERESEHFKSGLPPAPAMKGVQKTKKLKPTSPQEKRDNAKRQQDYYVKNRAKEQQRKRDERKNAPKTSAIDLMLDMGVHPRSAVGLVRMLHAKKDLLKTAGHEDAQRRIAEGLKLSGSALCNTLGERYAKVAKGGGACFLEGSRVKVPTGTVAIEELNPGAQVIGFDEITGVPQTLTVAKTASSEAHEWNEIHTVSTSFAVTDSHPLLTRTGWVNAGNLSEGDTLLTYTDDGESQPEEIISIHQLIGDAQVHVIEIVEDPHNYIINGVVAHNAKISDDDDDEGRPGIMKAEDTSDEAAKEASIRRDEMNLIHKTVKMGYAIAKAFGSDDMQAMAAGYYAATQLPSTVEVDRDILTASYWS